MAQWQAFWFEGNQCFGVIDSKEKWAEVVAAYKKEKKGIDFLRNAREHPRTIRHIPEFGVRLEHTGFLTLGEWADDRGIDLSVR